MQAHTDKVIDGLGAPSEVVLGADDAKQSVQAQQG